MAPSAEGVYEVRAVFGAPLDFAFRWCLDYSSRDPALEGSSSTRRVLERKKGRIVYEDLERTKAGWSWSRSTVRPQPPARWHADILGNYRSWDLDYWLVPLGPERTEFHLRGRRRPMVLGLVNPSKAELERELTGMWKRYARALEADYRRSLSRRTRSRRPARQSGSAAPATALAGRRPRSS